MARTFGAKVVRHNLAKLIRAAERGEGIVITRRGIPVAILMGVREYRSLAATMEEMADPGALRALRAAQADDKAGRTYSYEKVFGHPPRHT